MTHNLGKKWTNRERDLTDDGIRRQECQTSYYQYMHCAQDGKVNMNMPFEMRNGRYFFKDPKDALEMKAVKNTVERIHSRWDTTNKKLSELTHIARETIANETNRWKQLKKMKKASVTCGIVSTLVHPNSYKGEGSGKTKYIYMEK